jgi:BirA family biotin operon repressor/biotin-[acetyl-CoA-carboxylase] ligase
MTMPDTALTKALQRVRENGYVLLQDWPRNVASARELGLVEAGGAVRLPTDVCLHDLDSIRKDLPDQLSVQLYDYIDSTNSAMLRRHEVRRHSQAGAANHLILTEFQSAGRGRRGKVWLGDYGRNIAMTLGIEMQADLKALGGLSSVVGLALVQALEVHGLDAQLKWPNDVWVDKQKLAGILVELVPTNTGTLAVVGVGVNVDLSNTQAAKIDQAVTSLKHQGCAVTRDTMVSTVSTSISESFEVFARKGFRAFVEAFNAVHCLQNQDANLLIGHETVAGIVRGVDVTGGLIFEDKGGTRIVTSGEVSLRPA